MILILINVQKYTRLIYYIKQSQTVTQHTLELNPIEHAQIAVNDTNN
jgi:hypothetical protein